MLKEDGELSDYKQKTIGEQFIIYTFANVYKIIKIIVYYMRIIHFNLE